ncbi:MAG: porin [Cytophaga sp.]|uniref:porin n=1 Tax=Cytophaga sp. TaxID=29535 RepID=UPI003F7FE709
MKKFALVTLASFMFSAFTSQAEVKDDSTKSGKLTISGYADVYYQYNLNNPSFVSPTTSAGYGNPPISQNPGRIFDVKNNQFSLGLVQTKFAYTTDRSEVVLDLAYGPNAALGNFGNLYGTDVNIKQAYMSYMFTDKLNVTVGQFGTHVGYELIDAPLNYNYSLSYLFGNGPFYHTGAKASYAFSDKVGLMAGVVNGWDGMYDFNGTKSAIAQLFVSPTDGFNIYINYIGGDEKNGWSFPTLGNPNAPISGTKNVSHLFDLTTTYQITDAFKLGVNAAYGFGNNLKIDAAESDGYSKASWGGAALYADYRFSEFFGLGLRAEHFEDKDAVRYIGATLGGCTVNEFTLTGDLRFMDGHFNLKPEFRIDVANVNDDFGGTYKGYVKDPGNPDKAKATNVQPTIGMAAIYAF